MCLLIPAAAGSVHSHWTKEFGKGKPGSIGGSSTSSTLGKCGHIRGWKHWPACLPREGLSWPETLPVGASLDDSFPDSPGSSLRMTVHSPDYQLQPATLRSSAVKPFKDLGSSLESHPQCRSLSDSHSIWHLLCTGHHSVSFAWIHLFNPPSLRDRY